MEEGLEDQATSSGWSIWQLEQKWRRQEDLAGRSVFSSGWFIWRLEDQAS
jgi:hypothetical protein